MTEVEACNVVERLRRQKQSPHLSLGVTQPIETEVESVTIAVR